METRRISFKRIRGIEHRTVKRYSRWGVQAFSMSRRAELAQDFRDRVLRRWGKWCLGSDEITLEVFPSEGFLRFYR